MAQSQGPSLFSRLCRAIASTQTSIGPSDMPISIASIRSVGPLRVISTCPFAHRTGAPRSPRRCICRTIQGRKLSASRSPSMVKRSTTKASHSFCKAMHGSNTYRSKGHSKATSLLHRHRTCISWPAKVQPSLRLDDDLQFALAPVMTSVRFPPLASVLSSTLNLLILKLVT